MHVMVLSTYPTGGERTGGVVRLTKMIAALRRAGYVPVVVAIVPPGFAARAAQEHVISLPSHSFACADWCAPGHHDVLTGRAVMQADDVVAQVLALADRFRPAAVLLEQPYLIDLALRLREQDPSRRLIYSSANIEAPLKRELAALTPEHYGHPDDLIAEVERMELLAARSADLIFAISPADEDELKHWCSCPVVLAGNGSDIASEPAQSFAPFDPENLCFGCLGSGYWPNVEGLAAVVEPSLAFLPPHARLVTIGRVGEGLYRHRVWRRGEAINRTRCIDLGFVPQARIFEVLSRLDALLMPVFVGGGSMLKAADVLCTGRPLIMSERATMGYEALVERRGKEVAVVADARSFRTTWVDWASRPKQEYWKEPQQGPEVARELSWDLRLAAVQPALAELLAKA